MEQAPGFFLSPFMQRSIRAFASRLRQQGPTCKTQPQLRSSGSFQRCGHTTFHSITPYFPLPSAALCASMSRTNATPLPILGSTSLRPYRGGDLCICLAFSSAKGASGLTHPIHIHSIKDLCQLGTPQRGKGIKRPPLPTKSKAASAALSITGALSITHTFGQKIGGQNISPLPLRTSGWIPSSVFGR